MRERTLFFIGAWLIVLAYLIALPTQVKNILFTVTGFIIIVMSYGSYFPKIKSKKNYEDHQTTYTKIQKTEKPSPKFEVKEKVVVEETVTEEEIPPIIKPTYEPVYQVRKSRTRRVVKDIPKEDNFIVEEEDVVVISSDETSN
jgi:flagellar biosynthesis component FlhA